MRPTRVLFDGRPLSDAHSRHRGIGVFARSLLTGLGTVPDVTVRALVQSGIDIPPGIEGIVVRRLGEHRFTVLEHRLRLFPEIRRSGADVFHSPALEPPVRSPIPWVQTLHDVTPLVYDDPFFRRERRHWER